MNLLKQRVGLETLIARGKELQVQLAGWQAEQQAMTERGQKLFAEIDLFTQQIKDAGIEVKKEGGNE